MKFIGKKGLKFYSYPIFYQECYYFKKKTKMGNFLQKGIKVQLMLKKYMK